MTITYSTEKNAALLGFTAVSNAFIIEFAKDAPPEYIAVYLYALMQCQHRSFENDDIAAALSCSEETVISAFEYWQGKGLLTILRSSPLHVEFGRTTVSPVFSQSEGKYAELLKSLRPVLGTRILSASDLKKVYDWIEIFGLTEDAVYALFVHCLDIKGARVPIRYLDEVAKTWSDNNILTADDAREYITSTTEHHGGARAVLKLLGMKRNPTEAEVALYKKWRIQYGLTPEVIYEVCATNVSAGNPSFAYLSAIMDSMHEKGVANTDELAQIRKQQDMLTDLCRRLFMKAGMTSRPNAQQCERVSLWLSDYHMTEEMLFALAEAASGKSQPFSFMCKTVARWNESDIHNLQDAKADLASSHTSSVSSKTPIHKGFMRHNYTESDLSHIGITFDDDDDE